MLRLAPGEGRAYGLAGATVAALTLLLVALGPRLSLGSTFMVYVLVVIGVALRLGSRPAVAAAVAASLLIDLCFVEPRGRLTIADPSEWLALLTFLVTALVVGQLTASLRAQAAAAEQRERETSALAEASWSVASQVDRDRALAAVLERLAPVSGAVAAAVIVRERDGALTALAAAGDRGALPDLTLDTVHRVVNVVINDGLGVAWTLDRRHWDKALELPSAGLSWLPLINESRVLGVLCLARPGAGPPDEPVRRVVESLANHAGVVLARENLARLEAETRALAEVDRLKTALLSMVSHDFRSPLAAIKASATGLMQDGEPLDSPTVREMLAGINSEVDRLNRMVENILALSRLEAGAWQPRVEPTPVAEVVGAALEGLSKADNARVAVRLAPDLDLVACDPVQMAQVLHNLIENALKYTSGEIEVAAEADESAVRLSVADRGPGLPPELSGEMFEPFVRARHLRESAVPGVGLGLTICRGLVEAHGGTLSALPRHGGGTVFEVRLPHATGDRS